MKKTFLNKKILVLGSDGFLGSKLLNKLSGIGFDVGGTSRKPKSPKFFYLDILKEKSIENFPWNEFDIVFDCIGSIDYGKNALSLKKNIEINVFSPAKILDELKKGQLYVYCSTHAALLSASDQNTYSLSKLVFEKYAESLGNDGPNIIILRVPALFSSERKNGLLHSIKESFTKKRSLKISVDLKFWHTMDIDRVVDIMSSIINRVPKKFIKMNIGYPIETDLGSILKIAQKISGSTKITVISKKTDHYIPDIKIQNNFCRVKARDFTDDLIKFFKT